jgi:hypothetical protein
MRKVSPRVLLRVAAALAALGMTSTASADQLQVTVTDNQPSGGFALAPVWLGIQNGTFNAFTPGTTASSDIATLAQFGKTAPLSSTFESMGIGVDTTLTSGNAIKQFLPGQSNSTVLNVSDPAMTRYFSFAGMVVPSNDFFIGNATPLQIFDSGGHFLGPMTIQVFGSNVWDSDTEAQSTMVGLTFIVGQTPGSGTQITDGSIVSFFSEPGATSFVQSIVGLNTAAGYQISHALSSGDLLATITLSSVPEPTSVVMLGVGAFGILVVRRAARARRAGRPA